MQRIRNIDEIIEGTLNESKINDKRHSEDFLRESNKKLNDYRGDFLWCLYGRDEKQKERYIKKTLDKRKKLFFQKYSLNEAYIFVLIVENMRLCIILGKMKNLKDFMI